MISNNGKRNETAAELVVSEGEQASLPGNVGGPKSRTTNYEQLRDISARSQVVQVAQSQAGHHSQQGPSALDSIWPIQLFGRTSTPTGPSSGGSHAGGHNNPAAPYQTSSTYPASAIIHWTFLIGSALSLILFAALLLGKLFSRARRSSLCKKSSYKWMLAKQRANNADRYVDPTKDLRPKGRSKKADILLERTILSTANQEQEQVPFGSYCQRSHLASVAHCSREQLSSGKGHSSTGTKMGRLMDDFLANQIDANQAKCCSKPPPHHKRLLRASGQLLVNLNGQHQFISTNNGFNTSYSADEQTAQLIPNQQTHHLSPAISSTKSTSCSANSSPHFRSARSGQMLEELHMETSAPLEDPHPGSSPPRRSMPRPPSRHSDNYDVPNNCNNNCDRFGLATGGELFASTTSVCDRRAKLGGEPTDEGPISSHQQSPLVSSVSASSYGSGSRSGDSSNSRSLSIQSTTVQMLSSSFEQSAEILDEPATSIGEHLIVQPSATDAPTRRKRFEASTRSASKPREREQEKQRQELKQKQKQRQQPTERHSHATSAAQCAPPDSQSSDGLRQQYHTNDENGHLYEEVKP